MLTLIKSAHTIVWVIVVSAISYVFYAGIMNIMDTLLWVSIGVVFMEGIVLLSYGWQCPFTPWAMKYTDNRKANFDIYLPEWLARHNKTIFTILFIIGVLLVTYNIISGR